MNPLLSSLLRAASCRSALLDRAALARAALLTVTLLGATLLGCTPTTSALEARFAREESCSGSVHVDNSGNDYTAEGCGKRVVYVCKSFASMSQAECVRKNLPNPASTRVGEGPRFPERIEDTSPNDRAR